MKIPFKIKKIAYNIIAFLVLGGFTFSSWRLMILFEKRGIVNNDEKSLILIGYWFLISILIAMLGIFKPKI